MGVNLSNYLGYVASERLLNEDELSNAVFFFFFGILSNPDSETSIGKRTNKPEW